MTQPESGVTSASTLQRLTRKWFIDPAAPISSFPPTERHRDSKVLAFTNGNRVTPLFDGETYMRTWAEGLSMANANRSTHHVWHTGLSLDDVGVRGKHQPGWNALGRLYAAHESGLSIYGLLSDHGYYGNDENQTTIDWLFAHGLYGLRRDSRYPNLAAGGNCCGSNHQKFACLVDPDNRRSLIGSADIHTGRWDTSTHQTPNYERYGKPTHEAGVLVEGPAVADIEMTFLERWNDSTRTGLMPASPSLPLLAARSPSPAVRGSHSVQVLHTYGSTTRGYSWSVTGEYTIWAAYLNALRTASSYIYIEDQYFLPFDFPPRFESAPGLGRDSDLVFQLGAAINRGVKVLIVVPSATEEAGPLQRYQKFQRDIGVAYLQSVATKAGRRDDFTIVALNNGAEDIYVHAKLLIVDDEFVLLGSANVNQKSMTHDSEVDIGVVDADGQFAKAFRVAAWAEHLAVRPNDVDDVNAGYALMVKAARRRQATGHVIGYGVDVTQPMGHGRIIRRIDPYAGPVRD